VELEYAGLQHFGELIALAGLSAIRPDLDYTRHDILLCAITDARPT